MQQDRTTRNERVQLESVEREFYAWKTRLLWPERDARLSAGSWIDSSGRAGMLVVSSDAQTLRDAAAALIQAADQIDQADRDLYLAESGE